MTIYSLLLVLVIALPFLFLQAVAFTVVTESSSSGVPSALIDGPQPASSMNSNGALTDPKEQEAVYDVMRATGNDWALDIPDVCRGRWHGIECMPDSNNVHHVTSLSFGALSDDTAFPTCDTARSYISKSITKLHHLKTLFFYRCFSYNPQRIPKYLGRLGATLQTLVLRENGLVGPIPNELGNLTRLRVLDLHKNNLNGSIPKSLGRLTGLRSLDLSFNMFNGPIPDISFRALNVLDFSQNLLMGPIPSTLGDCESLLKMDLSRNRLTGPLPHSIASLRELILMDVSYNRLVGPLPFLSLRKLTSLQVLNLKVNPAMSMTLPNDAFDGMDGLTVLIFSNTNLGGSIPDSLGRLPNLRVVYLDRNRLSGSIPKGFQELKNLSELRLNDNQLVGPIPLSKETVWRMKRKLKLHNNFGLCYGTNSGFEDASMDLGIGLCTSDPRPSSTRNMQP